MTGVSDSGTGTVEFLVNHFLPLLKCNRSDIRRRVARALLLYVEGDFELDNFVHEFCDDEMVSFFSSEKSSQLRHEREFVLLLLTFVLSPGSWKSTTLPKN